jgi:monothiol glutaredoxin
MCGSEGYEQFRKLIRFQKTDFKNIGSFKYRQFQFGEATMSDVQEFIRTTVTENPVVLFMKGTAQFPQCGFSGKAIQILKSNGVKKLVTVNVLEDDGVRQGVKEFSNWPTVPQLYVAGEFIGGSDIMNEMNENGELKTILESAGATVA